MPRKPVIWTVGLQCRPEDDQKFRKWYDEVHVPMLLEGGHVAKVTRYELARDRYDVAPGAIHCPKYHTIYEFEDQQKFEAWMCGEARVAAGKDKSAIWGDRGYEVIWAARYDATITWEP